MNEYRIIHRKHFGRAGIIDQEYFMVQELKLKYPWSKAKWCTFKSSTVGSDTIYKETISFITLLKAEDFIKRIVAKAPIDEWVDKVVG